MTDEMLPTIAREPTDVAEALDLHARIDAVKAWLDQHRDRVRLWLDGKADEIEGLTGGAFNVPVSGVGRGLRTDPDPRVVVTDPDALRSWWHGEHPDECKTVQRVEIIDRERFAEIVLDVATAVGETDSHSLAETRLQERLADAAVVLLDVVKIVEDIAIPEDVVDRLTPTDDGRVVDVDGQIVDGVEVKTAARVLQVRIDGDRKDELLNELAQMLAPSSDSL